MIVIYAAGVGDERSHNFALSFASRPSLTTLLERISHVVSVVSRKTFRAVRLVLFEPPRWVDLVSPAQITPECQVAGLAPGVSAVPSTLPPPVPPPDHAEATEAMVLEDDLIAKSHAVFDFIDERRTGLLDDLQVTRACGILNVRPLWRDVAGELGVVGIQTWDEFASAHPHIIEDLYRRVRGRVVVAAVDADLATARERLRLLREAERTARVEGRLAREERARAEAQYTASESRYREAKVVSDEQHALHLAMVEEMAAARTVLDECSASVAHHKEMVETTEEYLRDLAATIPILEQRHRDACDAIQDHEAKHERTKALVVESSREAIDVGRKVAQAVTDLGRCQAEEAVAREELSIARSQRENVESALRRCEERALCVRGGAVVERHKVKEAASKVECAAEECRSATALVDVARRREGESRCELTAVQNGVDAVQAVVSAADLPSRAREQRQRNLNINNFGLVKGEVLHRVRTAATLDLLEGRTASPSHRPLVRPPPASRALAAARDLAGTSSDAVRLQATLHRKLAPDAGLERRT